MQCQVHKLIADVCLLNDSKVLLVKYSDTNKYDHQSGWFLPRFFRILKNKGRLALNINYNRCLLEES